MLLEFLAFVRLRMKHPMAPRPYKIPLGRIGSTLVIIPPALLIFVELAFASLKIMIVSLAAVIVGLLLRPPLGASLADSLLRPFAASLRAHGEYLPGGWDAAGERQGWGGVSVRGLWGSCSLRAHRKRLPGGWWSNGEREGQGGRQMPQ